MRTSIYFLFFLTFSLVQITHSAESACRPLPEADGDFFVALVTANDSDSILQIDFDKEEVCKLDSGSIDSSEDSSAPFHVDLVLNEFAVEATFEQGFTTWIRIDKKYSESLLLDRKTGEGLGLTEAEFLGDNSILEAEDFFKEFLGSLQIGSLELRDVEASIPRFGVSYDHYQGREPVPAATDAASQFLTVGTLGARELERLIITLDIANQRMYLMTSNAR